MNGYRIDLGSSIFAHFIKDDLLYVDKSLFIEHFLGDPNTVLLIARPRRMGKSLNMNMLSYYDLAKTLEPHTAEKVYHVFVFGMLLTLGYECSSNQEAGFGRFDLLVKAPGWTGAIEFKVAENKEGLGGAVEEALKQIRDEEYLAGAPKDRPAYAIGIGCCGKQCMVTAEKAW